MNKLASFVSKKLAFAGGALALIADVEATNTTIAAAKILGYALVGAAYVIVQGRIDSETPPPFDPFGPAEPVLEPDTNPCSDDPALD